MTPIDELKAIVAHGWRFGVVLADPPWSFSNASGNGSAENHYQTMKQRDLEALPVDVLAADNCLLLLWTTWSQLPNAMELAVAWGFTFKSGLPWVKLADDPFVDLCGDHAIGSPAYGTGFWVRGCSEPLLICTKGTVDWRLSDNSLGLISKRFEHSRKPDNVHDYAERFPGPWLELFARRQRPGWVAWGDQAPGAEAGADDEGPASHKNRCLLCLGDKNDAPECPRMDDLDPFDR